MDKQLIIRACIHAALLGGITAAGYLSGVTDGGWVASLAGLAVIVFKAIDQNYVTPTVTKLCAKEPK